LIDLYLNLKLIRRISQSNGLHSETTKAFPEKLKRVLAHFLGIVMTPHVNGKLKKTEKNGNY